VPFFFIVAPVAASGPSGCTYAEKRNGECEEDDSVLMDMDLATTVMFVAGCVLLACISYAIAAWFRYRFRAQGKMQKGAEMMQPMQPMHQQMPPSQQMRMLIDSLKEEAKVTGVPEVSVAKMNEASREFLNTVDDFERLIKEAKAPKHTEKTGPAKPAETVDDISKETTADSTVGAEPAADATGLHAADVEMPEDKGAGALC